MVIRIKLKKEKDKFEEMKVDEMNGFFQGMVNGHQQGKTSLQIKEVCLSVCLYECLAVYLSNFLSVQLHDLNFQEMGFLNEDLTKEHRLGERKASRLSGRI